MSIIRSMEAGKIRKVIVGVIAAALTAALAMASAESPPDPKLLPLESANPPASKARIHIKNDGRIPLTFYLSTNNRNWKRFQLPAGKARYYSTALKNIKFLYIKVKTRKRGFVNYRLRIGGQFMIRWNKKKRVWDVMRIEYVKEEKPKVEKSDDA